ncbi:MAG: hypothetical protein LBB54_00770, partial [Cellulomonadaceae bacterium]|nr:hypothetical protein [Cellulomonadaceae bacterium]
GFGIKAKLADDLPVTAIFAAGSLQHGTGVRGFLEADFFAVIDAPRPPSDDALRKVCASLEAHYPLISVDVRRPAVVCNFDGGSEPVEVVPAYSDGGSGFWIPDPADGGDWIHSFPVEYNDYLSRTYELHGGEAKKLARLVKLWKYRQQVPVSSSYLEARAAVYSTSQPMLGLVEDLAHFLFELGKDRLANIDHPTGQPSTFTACSTPARYDDATSKLAEAVTVTAEASHQARAGHDKEAVRLLKQLFAE